MTLGNSVRSVERILRHAAKSTVVRGGALRLFHRVRHKHALTVLMFHRVLPEQLSSELEADPEYTISTDLLDSLLGVVKSYYNIVDLPDVLASHRGEKRLPDVPMWNTFDDGGHDKAIFSAPLFAAARAASI